MSGIVWMSLATRPRTRSIGSQIADLSFECAPTGILRALVLSRSEVNVLRCPYSIWGMV
jgi:hypothetical protein